MSKYIIEIKNRITLLLINFITTIVAIYYYKETILFVIMHHYKTTNLNFFYFIFTNISEILSVYLSLVKFLSFQILILYITYNIFIFLSSAFFEFEYFKIKSILKTVIIVWLTSTILTNYIIIPSSWNFFLSFQKLNFYFVNFHFEAKLNEFFYFYVYICYMCLFYSEFLFIIYFFFNYKNTSLKIKKFRKLYYYCFVIFSTFIAVDITTQIFLSFTIILAYEFLTISFLIRYYFNLLIN